MFSRGKESLQSQVFLSFIKVLISGWLEASWEFSSELY